MEHSFMKIFEKKEKVMLFIYMKVMEMKGKMKWKLNNKKLYINNKLLIINILIKLISFMKKYFK